MGLINESFTVYTRPGPSGTKTAEMSSAGVVAYDPAAVMKDSAVLHEHTVVNVPYIATAVDVPIFAPAIGIWVVASVSHSVRVVGSDGSAVTADVMACTAGTAPASGVTQLASADSIDLKATPDTPLQKALATTLTEVGPGGFFAINYGGTLTAAIGVITVGFKRVR